MTWSKMQRAEVKEWRPDFRRSRGAPPVSIGVVLDPLLQESRDPLRAKQRV